MPNHYHATHDGFTFTRSSQNRTYTHVVITRVDHAQSIADAVRRAGDDWDLNLDYWTSVANGTDGHADHYAKTNPQYAQERQQDAREQLARGRDAYIEEARQRSAKRLASCDPFGRGYHWGDIGWCGRPDLAVKLANGKQWLGGERKILEAVAGKPPKAVKTLEGTGGQPKVRA